MMGAVWGVARWMEQLTLMLKLLEAAWDAGESAVSAR
jgi:hypothetical protein